VTFYIGRVAHQNVLAHPLGLSCEAGFCAAIEKVKNDLTCETHLKFYFASLLSTQLIILRCQNSIANTT